MLLGYDSSVLLALLVAGGFLILTMRWVFKPSRPRTGRPESGPGANLGLLSPVLTHSRRAAAIAAKDRLSSEGVRCSLSRIESDCYDVLVFAPDLEKAHAVLHS
jgi:hypothetical protein